jgi:aryl-alcohol dehydrogenase-like predicted oxidoreductase
LIPVLTAGLAESIVGEFIDSTRYCEEGGRELVKVITRYAPDARYGITKQEVRDALFESQNNLQIKTLDLVLLTWSDFKIKHYAQVAQHLAGLRAVGLIREIGVTDFGFDQLEEIVDAGIPISTVQIQYSLLCRHLVEGVRHLPDEGRSLGYDIQGDSLHGTKHSLREHRIDLQRGTGIRKFCLHHGIKIIAYGALGGGLLSDEYMRQHRPNTGITMSTPSLDK